MAGDIADQTPLVNTLCGRLRRRHSHRPCEAVIRENEEFLRYGLVIGSSGPVKQIIRIVSAISGGVLRFTNKIPSLGNFGSMEVPSLGISVLRLNAGDSLRSLSVFLSGVKAREKNP